MPSSPEDASRPLWWSPWLRWAVAAGILLILAWFVLAALRNGEGTVDLRDLQRHPGALAIAIAGCAATPLLFAWGWAMLVRSRAADVRTHPLFSVFLASWLLRYIPGKLPALGVRVYLGSRAGYAGRPLVIGTGVQLLLDVAVSVVAGAILLAAGALALRQSLEAGATLVVVAALAVATAAGAVLASRSRRPGRALNALLVRMRQSPVGATEVPRRGHIAGAGALTLAGTATNALAVYALLVVFADAGPAHLPLVLGAVTLAGVAGIVVALAPGGLGVREGVLVALLAPYLAADAVLLAALLVRLIALLADVLLAVVGGGHLLVDGLRASRGGTLAERRGDAEAAASPAAAIAGAVPTGRRAP